MVPFSRECLAVVRPVVKKVFSGSTLAAAKSLPVVGKHLLQRNIIKFAIPFVGVPLSAGVNFWTTKVAGKHAMEIFRLEAKLIEAATRLVDSTDCHGELPWVMWSTARSEGTASSSQRTLLNHVTRLLRERGTAEAELDALRSLIEIDHDRVWQKLQATEGDRAPLYRAAMTTVAVRGKARAKDLQHLQQVAEVCGVEHDAKLVKNRASEWA